MIFIHVQFEYSLREEWSFLGKKTMHVHITLLNKNRKFNSTPTKHVVRVEGNNRKEETRTGKKEGG